MKIQGYKKALSYYNQYNGDDAYSPSYGHLFLDMSNGEVWAVQYRAIGCTYFTIFYDNGVVCLDNLMNKHIFQDESGKYTLCKLSSNPIKICMKTIKEVSEWLCNNYAKTRSLL